MNIESWLKSSESILKSSGVQTSRLDAEILLADELGKDRSWIHAHLGYELVSKMIEKLNDRVSRRSKHEPLAYILGKKAFYGREFIVNKHTLTPRPETEAMVDRLLDTVRSRELTVDSKLQIVDIGTGSGCIIISAALELSKISHLKSKISFIGLDISQEALKIAKQNCKKLCSEKFVNVPEFFTFDLMRQPLTPYISPHTILLANLPYVPNEYEINQAATHEPAKAIFGGEDGLDLYRELFKQISINTALGVRQTNIQYILTEGLKEQHENLESIAKRAGYELETSLGLIQLFKTVKHFPSSK